MKKLLALAVFFSLASAVSAEVNFDQGADLNQIISESSEIETPSADNNKYIGHYSRDCARFTFGPSEVEQLSQKVYLRSVEYMEQCYITYVQQCHTVTVNGQPQQQCHQVPIQNCHQVPGQTWHSTAQVSVKQRMLFPWEKESFEACLEGPWMRIYKLNVSYKYSVKETGGYDTLFELTPQARIPADPDEAGLSVGSFSYDKGTKKYTFKVNDKWAKEYAGEKVEIKIELKKSITGWFDSSKGEKTFSFTAAPFYEMTFAEGDLAKPQPADSRLEDRASKGMYLKWGFKRIGKISTDKYVNRGETEFVQTK